MSFSWRNRTIAYDNIAVGSATGKENMVAGTAANFVYNTPAENNGTGNAQAENLERLTSSAGTQVVSPAASGLEIV